MKTNQLGWVAPTMVLFIIFISTFGTTAQTVQYMTLGDSTLPGILPLQTNQIITLVGYSWKYQPTITGTYASGAVVDMTPSYSAGTSSVSIQIPLTITGLTNILLKAQSSSAFATFQITTPTNANVVSNYVPTDAIVIPASATGNVQIILESSPDLVNWTAANPGIYGASAGTNRFFRVRAVAN